MFSRCRSEEKKIGAEAGKPNQKLVLVYKPFLVRDLWGEKEGGCRSCIALQLTRVGCRSRGLAGGSTKNTKILRSFCLRKWEDRKKGDNSRHRLTPRSIQKLGGVEILIVLIEAAQTKVGNKGGKGR